MNLLLGHSYFLRFDPKLWRAMQPYPPLGTLYAAAYLRERGHSVAVFDAMLAESTEEWQELLEREQPEAAVLFEDNFNYLSKMCLLRMREAAFEMIATAKARGIPAIVCGADVTDNPALYLEHGADYAVVGEGEVTLAELLEALQREAVPATPFSGGPGSSPASESRVSDSLGESTGLARIPGLFYRDAAGATVETGHRANLRDIDALPPPAYDLIDLQRYRDAWRPQGRFSLNLVTSRGCPFHCNWCAKPIWGQRYEVRSPEGVVDDVRRARSLGAEHLWFMDDILGLKPGWLPTFADGLEAAGLVTPFKCLARADLLLRPGEIEALKRAGCEMVWIGAESGSQSVLDAMEKGTTVAQLHEVSARLKQAGIGVAFFLQFGYPGETWDDVQATLQLVRDCDPEDIGMSVSYPLPGTPFYERVRAQIRGPDHWVDSEDMAMLYDGPYPTSFYHRLYAALHAEFRISKATRGASVLPTALRLLTAAKPRRAITLLKDALLLPLHRFRLDLARRRAKPNLAALPIVLTQVEAATPSAQDEAVGHRL